VSFLVDSDWIADYLKGRPDTVATLQSLAGEGLAVSIISYGEIYEGILFGGNRTQHERGFQAFLRGVQLLPLNRSIMRRFAQIRGDLRSQGRLIGDPDILIAATALQYHLTLLTRNVRDFSRIPGLSLHN
jgi:predicted nucleic acid-binding protein